MFNKIKAWNINRKTRNTIKELILNQHYELLLKQTESEAAVIAAKKAEEEAYESLKRFQEAFSVDDLSKLLSGIDTISNSPELTAEYYKSVLDNDKNMNAVN